MEKYKILWQRQQCHTLKIGETQVTDGIMTFIKKHLKVEYIITGEPQRTEHFDYPLDAIREIVINMGIIEI